MFAGSVYSVVAVPVPSAAMLSIAWLESTYVICFPSGDHAVRNFEPALMNVPSCGVVAVPPGAPD